MSNENLYEQVVAGPFKKLCGGGDNSDGTMEDCLTVAPLSGGGFALGDSKPAGAGRELRMSKVELTSFARAWLSGLAE
ncbi:hypothetical protein Misp01_06940 [Microtetraspora sp. NBRC 13810]|uniref:hypothetical protein n=1 Tax=Microtetraspora sp. NBRC 13810 TaxID=3030990 RepID=UPI0024A3BF76|nr:hypothetical protein [Microtetraspora sp. NBRC 13810]GLW05564.1 hypothetical protein Misp01_06940 [Microtetraspora sp. NBRC 13810]